MGFMLFVEKKRSPLINHTAWCFTPNINSAASHLISVMSLQIKTNNCRKQSIKKTGTMLAHYIKAGIEPELGLSVKYLCF